MKLAVLMAALAAASLAAAQERPSEEELFGAPPADAGEAEGRAEGQPDRAAPERAGDRGSRPDGDPRREAEAEMFGGTGTPAAEASPPPPPAARDVEDPLHVGGTLYLRAQTLWQEDVSPRDWSLASPNLLDVYLDVRPNDRVRGFALARTQYDPTIGEGVADLGSLLDPGAAAAPSSSDPRVALDQLWVNFDLARRVFVTAGRQHVKWGVGKFWNPTDYLHPVRRDPLAPFDERVGTTLVKLHAPWEKRGWNAYAIAMLEDVAGGAEGTDRLGRVGLGGRAEVVVGTVELGADALVQDGHRPRFGVDVSAGVWELDLYAEAALRKGTDGLRWREVDAGAPLPERFAAFEPAGFTPQAVVGGSWSARYSDEDTVTVGAEWFYNDAGYDDAHVYPFLLAGAPASATLPIVQRDPGAFRPFYLGKQYAGAFVLLPAPGTWNDTSFTLSVLGNLSDRSFVARLDHSLLALTYLRVETFVSGSFGTKGGEFRLGFDVNGSDLSGDPADTATLVSLPAPVLQAGIALRITL